MVNEATAQTSCVKEIHEADECRENIPPGPTQKHQIQVRDVVRYPSSVPSGENEPLPDTRAFASPLSRRGGFQANSRMSGLQSAFTPTLKRMFDVYSVLEQHRSLEPLQSRTNAARQAVPFFSFADTAANCQKPTGSSGRRGDSSRDAVTPVRWLHDESLPDVTLLDVTCDSPMQLSGNGLEPPDGAPATPVSAGAGRTEQVADGNPNSTMSSTLTPKMERSLRLLAGGRASASEVTRDSSETNRLSSEIRAQVDADAPPPNIPNIPNIPHDINSSLDMSASQLSASDARCDASSKDATFELPVETSGPADAANEELLTSRDADRTGEAAQAALDASGSVNGTFTVLQTSQPGTGSNTTAQTSCLMNVTQDINSSGHVSARCASKDVTFELPAGTSGPVEADRGEENESSAEEPSSTANGNVTRTITSITEQSDNVMEACLEGTRDITMDGGADLSERNAATLQTPGEDGPAASLANVTRDMDSSDHVSARHAVSHLSTSDMRCDASSKDAASELHPVEADDEKLFTGHDVPLTSEVNGTFPALQRSTGLNTTTETSCLLNKTSDIPSARVCSPTAEMDAPPASKNAAAPPSEMDRSGTTEKAGSPGHVPNATFDHHSLHKSSNGTTGGAGATSVCLRNGTLDGKTLPEQNGTITLSETSSSNSPQKTSDGPAPPEVCNATFVPKDVKSGAGCPPAGTDANVQVVDPPEGTSEPNPAAEGASASSGFPPTDGLSDSSSRPITQTDDDANRASTFNLDDTLDLKSDNLITSTPMNQMKLFNFAAAHSDGKTMPAQKRLYADGAAKPGGQPPNVVCDRKTFFPQPAAKSIFPPSKASQLLRYKPASKLPGCVESGLPTTRPKAPLEVWRNAALSDAPQETTGISGSYNLRAATTGTRQPISGLRKTQLSGIPSGIQRFAPGLRPPSTRSSTLASSTEKLCGPTAATTNPVAKASQSKKHPLIRNEPVTTAKKKKMDCHVSSGCAEASTTSNRAKLLKPPTTCKGALLAPNKRDGCAKCSVLLEENQRLKEENQRLKEDMLKYMKQKEEC